MKITKKQLKQIIKEELEAVIDEQISPEDAGWWEEEAAMAMAETDPCGASPPGENRAFFLWAECKCRDKGANRKDDAYIKCMLEHDIPRDWLKFEEP